MPGNQLNIIIGGNAQQLTQAAAQGASALNGFANAATAAGASSSLAFDEIAAGQAAMDRITASINAAAAAALNAGQSFKDIGSSAVTAIKPLATLENRLQEIRDGIGQAGTIQSAASLGVQFDIVSRSLQETKNKIDAATQSALGLSRAFTAVSTSSASLNRLSPAIKPALNDLRLLPTAANSAGSSLTKIVPGANQAGVALTNVGRVAQDLPFGFIGIQNNLNPLLESFQRLRAETGSNGAALKALGSSLIGAGGIGLALSIVSSAIVIFQNGIGGFNKKTKEAKEAADELSKAIREISVVQGEGIAGVQGQIAQVTSLGKAISDSTKPYGERKRALEELKEINKAYFGDLKLEDAATGKLTATINEYNKAIINSAIQKAFVDEIVTVSKAIVKSDDDIRKARSGVAQATAELTAAQKAASGGAINARTGELSKDAAIAVDRQREAVTKLADARKVLSAVNEGSTKLAEQRLILENNLNAATQEGLKFKDLQSSADKKDVDLLKQRIDALKALQDLIGLTRGQRIELAQLEIQLAERDGVKLGFTKEEISQQIDGILEKFFPVKTFEFKLEALTIKPQTVDVSAAIDVAGAVLPNGQISSDAFQPMIDLLKSGAENAKASITEIAIDLKSFLSNALAGAFSGLGEAIGNAFSGGGFQSIIGGFITIIGGAIEALGKAAIQAGVAALLLKRTIASFLVKNPALVIAAGVAAIALGTALKNAYSSTKIPGFAEGITNFSGGIALVGERGPEFVRLPGGSDVIPNSQIGGNGRIEIFGSLQGDLIYLANKRTAGRRRRM